MHQHLHNLILLIVCTGLWSCSIKNTIYDESADEFPVFEKALATIRQPKEIMVIFGANWCKDCVIFDEMMQQQPLKSLIKKHFVVIKVDVGMDGRNQEMQDWFGNPARNGIPSIAIVSIDKKIRYQTHAGELSRARDLTVDDILILLQDNTGIKNETVDY